jgi:hypothetical protein
MNTPKKPTTQKGATTGAVRYDGLEGRMDACRGRGIVDMKTRVAGTNTQRPQMMTEWEERAEQERQDDVQAAADALLGGVICLAMILAAGTAIAAVILERTL